MIYVMSDLHGCHEKYIAMLDKIRFSEKDTLYILGDAVDRGDGGIRILQDMMQRKNVIPLLGNHDDWAYKNLRKMKQPPKCGLSKGDLSLLQAWLLDGGEETLRAFLPLSEEEQDRIMTYLSGFGLYKQLEAGGNKFFLAHSVPSKRKMQNLAARKPEDFTFSEPEYEKEYFSDTYIVTGHTPTSFIDPNSRGRIWHGNRHIAIDCGAVFGNPLACLCLDTLEEFYVE